MAVAVVETCDCSLAVRAHSFMETVQSLNAHIAEVIKANKNVDDLREILVFLDTRLRQYTQSINEREKTAQTSVSTFRVSN